MTNSEKYYTEIGLSIPNAEQSQMFGKPCFKIMKKAFCSFFQDEMVFKLSGDKHAEALSLDGSQLFDPSGKGRAMKEWVQVPYVYHELWSEFATSAAKYVEENLKK